MRTQSASNWLMFLFFGLAVVAPARADVITLSTADSRFDPGVNNQGWYSSLGNSQDNNDNYITGDLPNGHSTRAFFTFDLTLAVIPDGYFVETAELELRRFETISFENDPIETIGLFDVSTDAVSLNDNDGPDPGGQTFIDLGTGTSYGTFDVAGTGAPNMVLSFELDPTASTDINASLDGWFSIGAALLSGDGNDGLFAASHIPPNEVYLVLEVIPIPEPGTLALLASAALFAIRRRRRP